MKKGILILICDFLISSMLFMTSDMTVKSATGPTGQFVQASPAPLDDDKMDVMAQLTEAANRAAVEAHENSRDQIQKLALEVDELREKLAFTQKDVRVTRDKLNRETKESKELEKMLKVSAVKLEKTQQTLKSTQDRLETTSRDLKDTIKSSSKELEKVNDALKKEKVTAANLTKEFQAKQAELQAASKSFEEKLKKSSEEMERLKGDLGRERVEKERLNHEFTIAQETLASATREVESRLELATLTEEEREASRRELEKLQSEYSRNRDQNASETRIYEDRIKKSEKEMDDLKNELKRERENTNILLNQLDKLGKGEGEGSGDSYYFPKVSKSGHLLSLKTVGKNGKTIYHPSLFLPVVAVKGTNYLVSTLATLKKFWPPLFNDRSDLQGITLVLSKKGQVPKTIEIKSSLRFAHSSRNALTLIPVDETISEADAVMSLVPVEKVADITTKELVFVKNALGKNGEPEIGKGSFSPSINDSNMLIYRPPEGSAKINALGIGASVTVKQRIKPGRGDYLLTAEGKFVGLMLDEKNCFLFRDTITFSPEKVELKESPALIRQQLIEMARREGK